MLAGDDADRSSGRQDSEHSVISMTPLCSLFGAYHSGTKAQKRDQKPRKDSVMNQRSSLQITVRLLTFICLLLLTVHCSLLTVWAQSSTATLSGTVTDANGAVVPGVDVRVTDPATGLKRTATTNDVGQ